MYSKYSLILFAGMAVLFSGCETRSKVVAKSAYGTAIANTGEKCKSSIASVEFREITKKTSMFAIPAGSFLLGGLPLVAMALTSAGITLDDEINANNIARNCKLNDKIRDDRELVLTVAQNATVSVFGNLAAPIGVSVQAPPQ